MVGVLCQHELRIVPVVCRCSKHSADSSHLTVRFLVPCATSVGGRGRIGGDAGGVAPCTAELGVFVQVDITHE